MISRTTLIGTKFYKFVMKKKKKKIAVQNFLFALYFEFMHVKFQTLYDVHCCAVEMFIAFSPHT